MDLGDLKLLILYHCFPLILPARNWWPETHFATRPRERLIHFICRKQLIRVCLSEWLALQRQGMLPLIHSGKYCTRVRGSLYLVKVANFKVLSCSSILKV